MIETYVGILLGSLVYGGIKNNLKYYENLAFYEEGARKHDLIPCFFRLQDIDPGDDYIKAYVKGVNGKYQKKQVPKPRVIHNRAFIQTSAGRKKIKKLQDNGIILFNERNRYTKLQVHSLLMKNEALRPHIPKTVKSNKENLKMMMEEFDDLIIKPNSGSLGSNVFKLTRLNHKEWELAYHQKKALQREVFSQEWPKKIIRILSNPRYIIQDRIPLATYQGNPFDLRVSVQRGSIGEWQVSGIVGKAAGQGRFLTNVARGGSCYSLQTLLSDSPSLTFEKVRSDIEQLSLDVASQLAEHLPNLADIGLDIGITKEGFPMFIECNARDLRITFRNAKLMEEWKTTHVTPMSYAKHLYDSINK